MQNANPTPIHGDSDSPAPDPQVKQARADHVLSHLSRDDSVAADTVPEAVRETVRFYAYEFLGAHQAS